jgi:predicted methyltransferase MtxX (methanogen marker protein 4)
MLENLVGVRECRSFGGHRKRKTVRQYQLAVVTGGNPLGDLGRDLHRVDVTDALCDGERERTVASPYLDKDALRPQVPIEHSELTSDAAGIFMTLRM